MDDGIDLGRHCVRGTHLGTVYSSDCGAFREQALASDARSISHPAPRKSDKRKRSSIMLIMRRPPIRLTPADEAVCRRWASAVLGVVATILVIVLATPLLGTGSPSRSALRCVDKGAQSTEPARQPSVACLRYQSRSNVRPGPHSDDAADTVHQVAAGSLAPK